MQQRDPEKSVLDYANSRCAGTSPLGIISLLLFGGNILFLMLASNLAWSWMLRLSISVAIAAMGLACGFKSRNQRGWNQFGSVVGSVLNSIALAFEVPLLLILFFLRLHAH